MSEFEISGAFDHTGNPDCQEETHSSKDEKLLEMGMQAGAIVHELNNILGVMLGYTQLAMEKAENDSDMHRYLERIFDTGYRGTGLVKKVLIMQRELEQAGKNRFPGPLPGGWPDSKKERSCC